MYTAIYMYYMYMYSSHLYFYFQDINVLQDPECIKQLGNVLKTNVRSSTSVGHSFVVQVHVCTCTCIKSPQNSTCTLYMYSCIYMYNMKSHFLLLCHNLCMYSITVIPYTGCMHSTVLLHVHHCLLFELKAFFSLHVVNDALIFLYSWPEYIWICWMYTNV